MRPLILSFSLVASSLLTACEPSHQIVLGPDWIRVAKNSEWQPRDSQGEIIFNNQIWILGGWFSPEAHNPRDIWRSQDGKQWIRTVEVAPWEHSDLSVSASFKDRMWIMGGRKLPGDDNSNQVWSSADGAHWVLEAKHAGWSPRVGSAGVIFKDQMWIFGGTRSFYDHSDSMVTNDVWSSTDGRNWTLKTANAEWSKRAHHQAVVFKNKIWILGGGQWHPQQAPKNDIWSSDDGIAWRQEINEAPWGPRLWFSAFVYRDHLWVLGGWSKQNGNYGDVWYTSDGKNWTELNSKVIWQKRHEQSAWVFDDKIWVAGGFEDKPVNDVWTLEIPPNWFESH